MKSIFIFLLLVGYSIPSYADTPNWYVCRVDSSNNVLQLYPSVNQTSTYLDPLGVGESVVYAPVTSNNYPLPTPPPGMESTYFRIVSGRIALRLDIATQANATNKRRAYQNLFQLQYTLLGINKEISDNPSDTNLAAIQTNIQNQIVSLRAKIAGMP